MRPTKTTDRDRQFHCKHKKSASSRRLKGTGCALAKPRLRLRGPTIGGDLPRLWKAAPMTSAIDHSVEYRRRKDTPHQKAWYWYDWANSAYVTTTLTVLMAPYLTVIAKKAACPTLPSDVACHTDLHVIGIPVDPGSLVFYVLTFSTIISAIVLIFIGALADRSPRPVRLFATFAWAGAEAASAQANVANSRSGVCLMKLKREHLYEYQNYCVSFILNHPAAGIFLDMG